MREIKFRAWDVANEYMVYAVDEPVSRMDDTLNYLFTQFEEGDYGIIPEGEGERLPLMQYTGLKDKNGKDIYEGDIVKTMGYPFYGEYVGEDAKPESERVELNYLGKVGIDPDGAYYDLEAVSSRVRGSACGGALSDIGDALEIIGNIHENPELLEKR
jgi:uncharacterized phage protein (TIGR01671 family)